MLRELYIRNLAVVKELRLPLGPGLTVLTGETGAGKSLLVDALLLALGERASQEMLRAGAQSATVEALFEGTHPLLQELGIEAPEGQMLLRRVLQAGGRSRAFINDISVSLQSLQQLGASLVDIHGQHEHQSLLSPSSQLALLDAVAGAEDSRQGLSRLHQELRVLRERLQELKDKARRRQEREEVLRFQLQEIQAAALRTGEEEELLRQQEILKHLSRLKELLEEAYALMYSSEGSALEALKRAGAALKEASRVDSSASSALGLLQEALPLVEEAALALRGLRQQYELEPQSLDAVQERLYLIQRLKAKYGPSIEDILRYAQRAEEELQGLGGLQEELQALKKSLAEKEEAFLALCRELSALRRKAARQLQEGLQQELQGLALQKARFVVQLREAEPGPSGADRVEFLFSANPGEPPKALSKVASGGELSRLMLAIKVCSRRSGVPVLVFDELDVGIGGKVANTVARKLRELSAWHQVLCITHLPQIAAVADTHLVVSKELSPQAEVEVVVREVRGAQRQEELARMLSGRLTPAALRHAKELMSRL